MKNLIHSLIYRKELIQSFWGHGILLIGMLIFSIFQPQPFFKHEKFYTVNLTKLGDSGAGGLPNFGIKEVQTITSQATQAPPKAKVQTLPKPLPKPITPPTPPTQKTIRKPIPPPSLAPKKKISQTIPKATPKPPPPTPSLFDRLKNRFEKIETHEIPPKSNLKFVEPSSLTPDSPFLPTQNFAESKVHFVEPGAWSPPQSGSNQGREQTVSIGIGGQGGQGNASGKEFPFSWYIDLVQNKITANWKEPAKSLIQNEHAFTIISFEILKNGQIRNMVFLEQSHITSLDYSVTEAVQASIPFPPLPGNYPDNTLSVKIKFELTQ